MSGVGFRYLGSLIDRAYGGDENAMARLEQLGPDAINAWEDCVSAHARARQDAAEAPRLAKLRGIARIVLTLDHQQT